LVTVAEIEQLASAGQILYRHNRYGAEYAVDRAELSILVNSGLVPILHVGQIAGIRAVTAFPIDWTVVLLWCPRAVSQARSLGRGDKDTGSRLRAWDETRIDLLANVDAPWTLVIRTDLVAAANAARMIVAATCVATAATPRDITHLI
jgi:guanylate kinase